MRKVLLASAVVLAVAGAPAAAAGQVVVVVASWTYSPTPVHVAQGQALTFANFDSLSGEGHSLTHAVARGTEKLFTSPIVPIASQASVAGVERLRAGTYRFTCRVHPIMAGTLVVE